MGPFMEILHINQSDIIGGAAIACYRLHEGLCKRLISSKILVDQKTIDSDLVIQIFRRRYIESLSCRFAYYLGLNYITINSTKSLINEDFYRRVDIVHFHNLHGGYFNYLAIPRLTRNKPGIFTLHDMWSFTGHCSYSFDCNRWKSGCGNCPYLDTYPEVACDNTALEWKLKNWIYNSTNLVIVSPSQWLINLTKESILSRFPTYHIPHGLDTNAYQPFDPSLSRLALGLPLEKKVLLLTAQNLQDPRKGTDLIIAALKKLPDSLKSNLVLITMGSSSNCLTRLVDIQTLSLGYVGGDRLKALIYSSADLVVCPTRADNLPLVLQESMACGVPIVSFNVGGIPELVRPGVTGLLAKPEDPADLSTKIVELLEDDTQRQTMATQCRKIAIKEYSIELQVDRYIALYQKTLANFQGCH